MKIDTKGEKLPTIPFGNSDKLEVGDLVLALGNPFGVGQTVTMGIVSALARSADTASDYHFFIQTDAAINPGNSGGALITTDGKLAGVNSAIYSRTGESIGIGFAIPANLAKRVVEGALGGGVKIPGSARKARRLPPNWPTAWGWTAGRCASERNLSERPRRKSRIENRRCCAGGRWHRGQ